MAAHAYSVQDAYIYGFALQEKALSPDTREDDVFLFGLDLILDGLDRRL